MPSFARGDVVWVQFPFSDDAGFKLRPAVVLALWPYHNSTDYFLCMVSTQQVDDPYLMPLNCSDFAQGSISRQCYVRPCYTFTADEKFIQRRLGTLKPGPLQAIIDTLTRVLNAGQ